MNPQEQADRVRALFADPRGYLHKDFHIDVRAHVVCDLLGGDASGLDVLDLGCGDGRVSRQFVAQCARLTWVDTSTAMLAESRRHLDPRHAGKVESVEADALAYRRSTGRFDVVICLGLAAHVTSLPALIAQLASLVRPGGRVLLQITDIDVPIARLLRGVYLTKRTLRGGRDYVPSPTSGRNVIALADAQALRLDGERRYWTALPGMGMLPNALLFRLQRYSSRIAWLSARGSERILRFVARGQDAELTR